MKSIGKNTEGYPTRMSMLSGMPDKLFCIGRLPAEHLPAAAIVGARMCSSYGHETAYRFGHFLASKGVQVISGMAIGVDGYAQRGAIEAGGSTFAILASGADVCYPRENRDLYEKIAETGGILSEQPPGTKPLPYYFPSRNRIISALADVVVVVEARERSGSLITVEFALTQGKTVLAVPGRIGEPLSDGCNRLIAEGAGIAWSAEAVLDEIHRIADTVPLDRSSDREAGKRERTGRSVLENSGLSMNAKTLYFQIAENSDLTLFELTERVSLPLPQVYSAVIELQLAGYIKEAARGHYSCMVLL